MSAEGGARFVIRYWHLDGDAEIHFAAGVAGSLQAGDRVAALLEERGRIISIDPADPAFAPVGTVRVDVNGRTLYCEVCEEEPASVTDWRLPMRLCDDCIAYGCSEGLIT